MHTTVDHSIKIMWNYSFTFPSFFVVCYLTEHKDTFPSTNFLQLSLEVSSSMCSLKLSTLTRIEKTVKNATIIVIYKVLVYIQMSQPTTWFGLF